MELKDFIEKTLVSIVDGVDAAKEQLKGRGVLINPLMKDDGSSVVAVRGRYEHGEGEYRIAQNIEFNVVVSAETNDGGKLGISVLTGFLKGGMVKEDKSAHITTIRFTVPISLPYETFQG